MPENPDPVFFRDWGAGFGLPPSHPENENVYKYVAEYIAGLGDLCKRLSGIVRGYIASDNETVNAHRTLTLEGYVRTLHDRCKWGILMLADILTHAEAHCRGEIQTVSPRRKSDQCGPATGPRRRKRRTDRRNGSE